MIRAHKLVLLTAVILLTSPGVSFSATRHASIDVAIAHNDLADVKAHVQNNESCLKSGHHSSLSPLHQSILRKRIAIAHYLIKAGAPVNAIDNSQRTPLHLCVERNTLDLVPVLVNAGAKTEALDKVGWTPLHHAAAKNRYSMAQSLIANGADCLTQSACGGIPLHEAAVSGGKEIIQLLLDCGSNPSSAAHNSDTPFLLAIKANNQTAIALFEAHLKQQKNHN